LKNESLDALVSRAALDMLSERAGLARHAVTKLQSDVLERAWLAHLIGIEPWPLEIDLDAALDGEAGLPTAAESLNDLAWSLVDPDAPPSGEEVRALLLARRAVAAAEADDVAAYRDTLARALFRLGRFDEALEEQRRALVEAPFADKQDYDGFLRRLEADVAHWRNESGELRRVEIAERMETLDGEIAALEQDPDVRRWLDEK
jgi:tetratricopeptide (TPR) repeat protein